MASRKYKPGEIIAKFRESDIVTSQDVPVAGLDRS